MRAARVSEVTLDLELVVDMIVPFRAASDGLAGNALRWGQRDQGDFDFPLDPFGIPLPLETTRAAALDPGFGLHKKTAQGRDEKRRASALLAHSFV